MAKKKIELNGKINPEEILNQIKNTYGTEEINSVDGVKIEFRKTNFPSGWVHLRKSNTEPIIRIYTESTSQQNADTLADKIISDIKKLFKI